MYLKDKFNISNEAWHELAMKANDVPKMYGMKKRISQLNSRWNLKPIPGDAEGVQIGFQDSLKENVQKLKRSGILCKGETIKIKLSGDGTNIGKRLTVVNFAYTILNEKRVQWEKREITFWQLSKRQNPMKTCGKVLQT